MGVNLIRDYQEADWPRLQAIHDAARLDELRLAGLDRIASIHSSPPKSGTNQEKMEARV